MLRYLCKVEVCPARHLRHTVTILPGAGACAISSGFVPWEALPVVGLSALSVSGELRNGQRVYTHTLTLRLKGCVPELPARAAFRLTDVEGRQYLLGTSERPYPAVKLDERHPAEPAEPSQDVVTVEWLSVHPLMPLNQINS